MKSKCKDDGNHVVFIGDHVGRSRKTTYLCFLTCIGVALFFGSFVGWYHYRGSYHFFDQFSLRDKDQPCCSGVPNLNKFDCHPEDDATESVCLSRGCCYHALATGKRELGLPHLNTPYCFYPKSYDGYSISDVTQDGRHLTAKLKRGTTPSGFPKDVQNLQLIVTFLDDTSLRIKITDQDAQRFEVPIPINDQNKALSTPIYTVSLDSKTGQLSIARKSTGTQIFKTELSRLVYADQFLQLSTYLPSPRLYGIGEHYGPALRSMNWTRLTLFNADLGPIPNHNLYGSHPFYLSLEPDGSANGVFLLNSNSMDVILQPSPAITFRPIGGILDFFVMLGPSPANVVQQYTGIVGRTPLPPYWSLGFHLCRYGYRSLNKTRETMQRTIDAGIPLDVQWNDIDYMERYKDFTYDKEKYDGLPEFVDEVHNQGRHYVVITDPGISNSEKPGTYPPYDEGVQDDVFIKNPNGSIFIGKVWTDGLLAFPDFSHPNAVSYWTRQLKKFHDQVKIDGLWIDMNEPSNFHNGGLDGCMDSSYEDPPYLPGGRDILRTKTICMTTKHHDTIHYNEHNLYAYREAFATNQALKTIRGKRPFVISRATFSGQQVNSGHWSGDISSSWQDLRYSIPSMLNFNMYGMSMVGSDICGFGSDTTVELCARWQALGAFYPFARNHNGLDSREQDPVAMGPVVVEATRKSLAIRYYFLPYLYTLFYRSFVFGDTVVRPIFFEYPQDVNSYSMDGQFMWGPAMMVMPVLYPNASSVEVYIPEGKWYNNTGFPIKSGSIPAAITDNINLAFRGGHIIPAQVPALTTTLSRKFPFVVVIILDEEKRASGELYWDDGDSLETYEKGAYNLINFTANNNTFRSTVTTKGYETVMDVAAVQIVGLEKEPVDVTANGGKCNKIAQQTEMNLLSPPRDFTAQQGDSCAYIYVPASNGMEVALKSNTSLLAPLTVTWN